MSRLTRDAERIRRHVGREASATEHAQMRARLVDAVGRRRPRRAVHYGALTLAVAAAAFCLWLVVGSRSDALVTFKVGASELPGSLGRYYSAPAPNALDLTFSDGSRVSVEPGGGARVAEARPRGATVVLERGVAHVRVEHRPAARWLLVAGPYTVEVTGTAFEMSWEPDASRLGVEMEHGSVVLSGPGMEQGVRLSGTETFVSESSVRTGRAAARDESAATSAGTAENATPETQAEPEPSRTAPDTRLEVPQEKRDARPPPTWRELAARGNYDAVLADADGKGVDVVLRSGSPADLDALADAARYRGRRDVAERTLKAVRDRFAGSAGASQAAYLLGRLVDDGGDAVGALAWYDLYLHEAPAGALAAEALGRKLRALERTGRAEAAREVAEDYLARFPDGPYASYASKLVAR